MNRPAYIFREKRLYNRWVTSAPLEDYALRHIAKVGRRRGAGWIANAALGSCAFLTCEAIGASITLAYGWANGVAAIVAAIVLMFLVSAPIAYHSAREGLGIDLLSRGAGFGYLGGTVTSLVFALYTVFLFTIEASIMSVALRAMTGLPIGVAHIVSACAVLPIAIYGMRAIARFQIATQPLWLIVQIAPIVYILWAGGDALNEWTAFTGRLQSPAGGISLLDVGFALSMILALLPLIGAQTDYLRFMPSREETTRIRWWLAVMGGGPGWTLIGGVKLLLGSFLASYAVSLGLPSNAAETPINLFAAVLNQIGDSPRASLILTGVFVIICQLKINVTNAYAGSIAWSNFFSRLTLSHPGRVVWLFLNVTLALLLMEFGAFAITNDLLMLLASVAAGWLGALAGDLTISRSLGLNSGQIEFKRAHLYDINPVGIGAMLLSLLVAGLSFLGFLGDIAQAFAPALGLVVAFVGAPAIALATGSRFYRARETRLPTQQGRHVCAVCETPFEPREMAHCPVYAGTICSLCCTLEARCHDRCKEGSSIREQGKALFGWMMPPSILRHADSPLGRFIGLMALFSLINALIIQLVYHEYTAYVPEAADYVRAVLWIVFFGFSTMFGVAAWILVLAQRSSHAAERETSHHMEKLIEEISAHEVTDAELQRAKATAESANLAKSRFLASVSHEIRSPLNSIYGYAQLLERDDGVGAVQAAKVIRRSSEHLSNLVEGLLDISQVESGVLRLSRDQIRFPVFLEQIADMFEPQAAQQGIEFVFQRPRRLPEFVNGDQKRLRQVLINLLSNALKFTHKGSVAFTVHYRNELATFEIADTGPGITEEDAERVFKPFERGSGVSAHSHSGVGLGLAITQALVHIMGGEIKLVSEVGEGSRFTVRVMLSQPLSQPTDTTPASAVTGYAGPGRTIMMVDDDPTQLAMLRDFLEPLGFAILTARDGDSGIALAARSQPDLVLLDISMPGKSGWETARALRQLHGGALKIVIVSADAHQSDGVHDHEAVHDMFLTKPVEFTMLLDTITSQLGLKWIGSDAGACETEWRRHGAAKSAPRPLPPQSRPYLAEIERLARIGYVRGIEAQIDALAETVPEATRLVEEMRICLDSFDLKALATIAKASQQHAR
ncbi:response regulator [Stakelama sp. CBK3Z-3]|uniref:histidine kinase n=1 Tax=Stakelama flava TaxID=2860338 RepID=A0ABS6XK26_9SPHN|nr:ATP-binding protein [Stakelama flava]MBW4330564.1 response regulator [Stakelama flava]